ncbi:MAG: RnfABCDGE type electron transport complex subunit B [Desulfobacterales bacterium]
MTWVTIGLSAGTLVAMAVVFSYILGWANQAFHVETDPRVEQVMDALPGANCGGCGYVGCYEYAEAVATDGAPVNKCTVGGANCAGVLADIMGVEAGANYPVRPVVHCGAKTEDRLKRTPYKGEPNCRAANLVSDIQGCIYGCLGFGDCEAECDYDAIHVIEGLAVVDYEKCVGCGACHKVCPRNIISMVPFKADRVLAITCSNKDSAREVREVCTVGCIGCKACSRVSNLFTINDNLAAIDYDAYDPDDMEDALKAVEKCPRKSLVFIGKPSESDLAAVGDREIPDVVEPEFKTTVDDTKWWG